MGELGEANRVTVAVRRIFAKVACKLDYFRSEGLPRGLSGLDSSLTQISSVFGIAGLHKYLPYRSWFQRELADYVKSVVSDARAQHTPFWNLDFLEYMVREHIRGRKNYTLELNAVLTLEAVERLLLRGHRREAQSNDFGTSNSSFSCREMTCNRSNIPGDQPQAKSTDSETYLTDLTNIGTSTPEEIAR